MGRHGAAPRGGQSLAGGIRPRRRGLGAGWRRRDPVSLGLGEATSGTGGVVWPNRDEYAGSAPAGFRGTPRGDVSEVRGAYVSVHVRKTISSKQRLERP